MGLPGKENPSGIADAFNLCGTSSCAVGLRKRVCGVAGVDGEAGGGERGGGGGGGGGSSIAVAPQLPPAMGGANHLE